MRLPLFAVGGGAVMQTVQVQPSGVARAHPQNRPNLQAGLKARTSCSGTQLENL